MISRENIVKIAREVGFNLCGTTTCDDVASADFFEQWLKDGYGSELPYLARRVEIRRSPRLLFEGARSVIVCAVNYRNALSGGYPRNFEGAKVASYALMTDYHTTIKAMLLHLATRLKELYPSLEGRCYVDTAPLLEKALAVRAGLGQVGRNSLLITQEYGSFVLLGELVINDEIDQYDTPLDWAPCESCHLCEKVCPVAAINGNRTIDPRRCISARTVEGVAGELSKNGWVCGCDECQSKCPHNQSKPLCENELFAPVFDPLTDEYQNLLGSKTLNENLAQTPLARAFRRK